MSLIIKPPSWGYCSTNLTGTPSTTVPGTAVTAGALSADGTAVTLLSTLAHDVEYLVIGASNFAVSTENSSTLLDILVDPAGGTSWVSGIDDLIVGYSSTIASVRGFARWYHFPFWLKSGHSIGARARTARATTLAGRVVVYAYGGNANPGSWWCGQNVTTFGVTPASSTGTAHTPGNSGAFSSWASVGSTTPAPIGALQFGVNGTATNTSMTAVAYHWQIGYSSTQIGPTLYHNTAVSEEGVFSQAGPIFASIPAGTQLQTRATCNGTAQIIDVALYGVH